MVDAISAAGAAASQTKSEQSSQKLAEDMDHFMNLLVTQLKNQDPLDPMDPNEFTSQLVQFASVEQQIQGNANLERMVELQEQTHLGTVVGYIDKMIEANGTDLILEQSQAKASYTLDARATSTTINVLDSTGRSVFTTSGIVDGNERHTFTWNGVDSQGNQLDDGMYTLSVDALDADGEPIGVTQTMIGTVTGVSMDGGDASLYLGEATVSMDDVIGVEPGRQPLN